MGKDGLLLVRVPFSLAGELAKNPGIADRFNVVTLDLGYLDQFRMQGGFAACYAHGQDPALRAELESLVRMIVVEHQVTHAVVLTPLFWYSEAIAEVLDAAGVNRIWSEVFLGGKLIFDRLGCQYTTVNEVNEFGDILPAVAPDLPVVTRFKQPEIILPKVLRAKYGVEGGRAMAVLGQVPSDNALKDTTGGLPYYEWLDAIFRQNPDTKFIFKHHPVIKINPNGATEGLEKYPNVRVVDESIWSLFLAFDGFVSYSSTAILEGLIQRKRFATGGFHFMAHPGLCLRVTAPEDAASLYERVTTFAIDPGVYERRIGFVTQRYTLRQTDPRMVERILLPSAEFYGLPVAAERT